jgi:hypothetical protein
MPLSPATATWRSGYATVCKTVYPGSIPGVASSLHKRNAAKAVAPKPFFAKADAAGLLRLGKTPKRPPKFAPGGVFMLSKPAGLCYMRLHASAAA